VLVPMSLDACWIDKYEASKALSQNKLGSFLRIKTNFESLCCEGCIWFLYEKHCVDAGFWLQPIRC